MSMQQTTMTDSNPVLATLELLSVGTAQIPFILPSAVEFDQINFGENSHTYLHDKRTLSSVNQSTKIDGKSGAQVHYLMERHIPNEIQAQEKFEIVSESDATLMIYIIIKGYGHYTLTCDVQLLHPRASVTIIGIYHLHENAQLHFESVQHHVAHHTTSRMVMRGILDDQAYARNYGRVVIDQNGYNANAHQENKHLLLSKGARVIAYPTLEVRNSHVQCSHGSAVGKVDKDALTYLQMRGFEMENAQRQLRNAFTNTLFVDAPSYVLDVLNQAS
jgi:Fe-S cluster assembly scaffold protein SufB